MSLQGVWRAVVLWALLGGCGDPQTSSDAVSAVTPVTSVVQSLCEQAVEIFEGCVDITTTYDTDPGVIQCDPGSLPECQSQCAVDHFDGGCESLLDLTEGADYYACIAECAG